MVTKNNILITAGSTWVPIDKVRVISNIASGKTGFILANKFKEFGARVTLLLGPGDFCGSRISGVKIISFKYFSELDRLLRNELKKRIYAAVIHTAAVADYRPKKIIRNKISSRLANWKISLVSTKKLVNNLKDYDPGLIAVGFKFEPDAGKKKLVEKSKRLLKQANLDIVVANSNKNKTYQAYILDTSEKYGPFFTKSAMAVYLSKIVKDRLLKIKVKS
ncbi:MAG: phosphopantothenoylcysteine decarboxylase [Candidatus Omnitrophica bacterium]|nr:phosphopantothenoylcysteine decarboxylase [Candidatus Omnitrophota bacterium]MDD5690619.1 phosphopantothenoylcysteine decarboxylase [Candidatus Omnitrophota bacterium]